MSLEKPDNTALYLRRQQASFKRMFDEKRLQVLQYPSHTPVIFSVWPSIPEIKRLLERVSVLSLLDVRGNTTIPTETLSLDGSQHCYHAWQRRLNVCMAPEDDSFEGKNTRYFRVSQTHDRDPYLVREHPTLLISIFNDITFFNKTKRWSKYLTTIPI